VETLSRTTTVDGELVRWRVVGSGPPLVLVHGLSGSWRWWRPVLEALAASHELHLVDLPRARGIARRHGGDTVAWLSDWLAAAKAAPASIIGHSLGGLTAAELAARRPEQVERLVLVAPVGVPSGRGLAGHAVPLASTLVRTRPALLPRLARDALRTGPSSLLRGALDAKRADLRADLSRVRAPTLLVWGERDALVPPAAADTWQEGLPDARLVRLPRAGHVPMWEAPGAFSEAVLGFLEEPLDQGGDPLGR
jgi:pimeloyl-ACP methyl ester carboxylesterase